MSNNNRGGEFTIVRSATKHLVVPHMKHRCPHVLSLSSHQYNAGMAKSTSTYSDLYIKVYISSQCCIMKYTKGVFLLKRLRNMLIYIVGRKQTGNQYNCCSHRIPIVCDSYVYAPYLIYTRRNSEWYDIGLPLNYLLTTKTSCLKRTGSAHHQETLDRMRKQTYWISLSYDTTPLIVQYVSKPSLTSKSVNQNCIFAANAKIVFVVGVLIQDPSSLLVL